MARGAAIHPVVAGMVWSILAILAGLPSPTQAAEFSGVVSLHVDLSDIERRIFRVTETLPASAGKLVLLYPQWLPGNHAPRGPIEQLAGLTFRAADRSLTWRRDPLNMYRFEVEVPAGATAVTAEFQVATPQGSDQGRVVVTTGVLGLQWNQVLLYPEGYAARDIPVRASLRLPESWGHATALRTPPGVAAAQPGQTQFATVPLEVLVDSPVFAGRNFRAIDLTPAGSPQVVLNVVAEEAADLAATDAAIDIHRALLRETYAALGPPRFDRYDFLLALSSHFGGIGLEHHRSSENSMAPAYFRSWEEDVGARDLLAHELTHSWNGKYRRPARLWTPHYNTPMQDDLLWVYEGMTQYYGQVLAARSGLYPQDFAAAAAVYERKRPGRSWRSLEDTTLQPIIAARRPLSWPSWQRPEDYYVEGAILWLNVDTKLRELTAGRRSLDDFSRTFFAAPATQGWVSTYELDDVVRALGAVAPFDWAEFLRARVTQPGAPVLEGFERSGLQLVFTEQPNKAISDSEQANKTSDLSYSLGVVISRDNVVTEVVWDSPAFKAGLTTNTTLVAVNGRVYSAELLKAAITAAKLPGSQIDLLLRNQDRFRTVRVEYRDGLRYPHLQAIAGREDGLKAVLAPRASLPAQR
jgi:predicted metalloprotease with PDZ domain